jgi:transposase
MENRTEQSPGSCPTIQEDVWSFPFSEGDWQQTPRPVQAFLVALVKRIEELERRLNQDSNNSSRPPSSDSPFKKKARKEKKRKSGAKKGHQGHRQVMLEPTETVHVKPERCCCGNREFGDTKPYYTHQEIELPEIEMKVTHFILHEGRCRACGKINKAQVPAGHQSGYGARLSALIGEMAGIQGNSRATVQGFCSSVLNMTMSKGAVQKVIDRVSEAIKPYYEGIGRVAREAKINHIDETSWFMNGVLMWLWAMANTAVAFFMIHPRRSKEAFSALIEDWAGILVSDGFKVYQQWIELRQTCLAHLIRKARELSQRKDSEIAAFGRWAMAELQRLCHMAHAPPSVGQWRAFYARLSRLISENHDRKDSAGKFARRLVREMDSLWVFLEVQGVEPTNNRVERALRPGVLWRKRSQGTASDKGNRWVERILSLKQTCSIQSRPTFPILVEALECYFKEQNPDLSWIAQHSF